MSKYQKPSSDPAAVMKGAREHSKRKRHKTRPCGNNNPVAPTGVILTFDTNERGRHTRIRGKVSWNETDETTSGAEAQAKEYVVNLQRSVDGVSWTEDPRRQVVKAKDDDAGTVAHAWFVGLRKRYFYRARVRAISKDDCKGAFSAYTGGATPNDNVAPPAPTNVTGFVDQHRLQMSWDPPTEGADADIVDEGVAFFQVQVATDSGFTNIIRRDRVTRNHVSFKIQKPGATYWFRVRSVDSSWNKSAFTSTSASKLNPNAPSVAIAFDVGGPKRSRYRMNVTVTPGGAFADDDIHHYDVAIVTKAAAATPTGSDRRRRSGPLHPDDDDLVASFGNVRKGHFTYARARSVDFQGRSSGWSSWVAGGKPTAAAAPATPSGLTVTTQPRRVVAVWNEPAADDDEIVGYQVEVRRGGALRHTRFTKHAHMRYAVPAADRGLGHEVRVRSVDDMGNLSAPPSDVNGTPNDRLDDTDLLDAFNQGSGKVYTFDGTIRLVGAGGAFQTGDPATESVVSLSRVDGKDQVRFKPFGGGQTVLEVHADGIRWGATGASTVRSLLAVDGSLQIFKNWTTTSPNVSGTDAAKLYVRNPGSGSGLALWVKFGSGPAQTKQLAHNQ